MVCLLLYYKLYLVHALLYIIYVVILVFVVPCVFVPLPLQYLIWWVVHWSQADFQHTVPFNGISQTQLR
jgi:hypothetical protein